MQKGKLIVIDGGDNVGKATQTKLLLERLQKEGKQVGTLDFPRYETNTYGKLIRECLKGERGDFLGLDPRIASTLYAADRFESKETLSQLLDENDIVILDRYVSANMLHQGAKIDDLDTRKELVEWLEHIEFDIFGIPRPDLTISLSVDFAHSDAIYQAMVASGEKEPDVAERDREHQKAVVRCLAWLSTQYANWVTINCSDGDQLRSREAIHEDVYFEVSRIL